MSDKRPSEELTQVRPQVRAPSTVAMPQPGTRTRGRVEQGSALDREPPPRPSRPVRRQPYADTADYQQVQAERGRVSAGAVGQQHHNPLLSAASTLLNVMSGLRVMVRPPHDITQLREEVVEEVGRYERNIEHAGVDGATVQSASFALCGVIDEIVLNTAWGRNSDWSVQSVLATIHGQHTVQFGDAVFEDIERACKAGGSRLHLLELYHACLGLGFQGKYAFESDGSSAIARIRERIYSIIRDHKGAKNATLAMAWRGEDGVGNAVARYVPVWVMGAVAALALLGIFLAFKYVLQQSVNPTFLALSEVGRDGPTIAMLTPPLALREPLPEIKQPDLPAVDLRALLAHDIERKTIRLAGDGEQTTIIIQGDGLFPSGKATVRENVAPLLARVADAMNQVPGVVLVAGHTDDVPIATPSFPNNWALSEARARAVSDLLIKDLQNPGRVMLEGLADKVPLVPNDSRANRALNRRVEITLPVRTPGLGNQ